MCRLAAFPPGFEPRHAERILSRFVASNTDGTGSVYVKDGEFVVNKWPIPLDKALNKSLLSHMPYDGWTVVHLRAASHGGNKMTNTHPFVKGKWSIVHNGIWSEYDLVKSALKKYVSFEGETDTEVAAQLFADVGPKRFSKLVEFGGVFIGLNLNGDLWVVKTSGDLEMVKTKKGQLLGSTLPEVFEAETQPEGWLHFNTKGELVSQHKKSYSFARMHAFLPPGMEFSEEEEVKPKFGYMW